MGCALSKDVESPSKGFKGTSSWINVIQRRFTIQINRSLKTTDGGYIAAIFSANYGILRKHDPVKASDRKDFLSKHAPVKALDKKDFLQNPSQTESYPTQERCPTIKSDENAHANLVADTVLGVPMVSVKSASELLEAQKSIESSKENLETINILELMEGFAEEAVVANFENLYEPSNLLPPATKQESLTLDSSKPTTKVHTSEALSTHKIARRRPKSLSSISSIRCIEDVDMALSARRGKTFQPLKSSGEVWQKERDINAEIFFPIGKTILDNNIKPHDGNDINISQCTSITTLEDPSLVNADNLQRVLSFKYMFNHSSSESQKSLDTNLDALDTPVHKATSDSLVFATARFLYEGEGTSSPSSPDFSAAASLKDWLASSSLPSTPSNSLLFDHESSISETLQFFQPSWEAAEVYHASTSKVSESLCVKSVSNQWPSLQCQDGPELEDSGIPIFDPEMVDSFENAMRHLSKEEWNAVRGMEDSPRNFLRLVKALKKSRSNSSQKEKAANLDIITMKPGNNAGKETKDGFEPLKSPGSKSKFAENKGAFMRQNSLEVGKAFSQVRVNDKGTARVVFYSSTAQVEDCSQVRSILQSLVGICYNEKSVSDLEEHEQELRQALNISVAVVPTIYAKGKYLVGIDSILHLYKKGLLGSMLREAGGSRLKGDDAMHLLR